MIGTIDRVVFDPSRWEDHPRSYRDALIARNLGGSRRPAPFRILSRHQPDGIGGFIIVYDVWDMRKYLDNTRSRPRLKHMGVDDFDEALRLSEDAQRGRRYFVGSVFS